MRWRVIASRSLAVLGVGIIGDLLYLMARWEPERLRSPVGVGYATLWILAGIAGVAATFGPPPHGWSQTLWERLPWWAGGLLLGFAGPFVFSIGFFLFVGGIAFLGAAALHTPRLRYALEALVVLLATTGGILLLASAGV